MADLRALQEFAAENGFDLTRPLTHAQADLLAQYWAPDMRFHEDERFHPIALDEVVSMVETHFAVLPEQARATLRVPVTVRRDAQTAEVRMFDPPVVRVPDGVVPGNAPSNQVIPVARVLTDGRPVPDAMALPEVGDATVLTHGANVDRANAFFGASQTFSGGSVGLPGDPFVPRARESAAEAAPPRVTVLASLMNLLDLLRYELLVSADDDYPSDALRRAFDVSGMLLRASGNVPQLPFDVRRAILLALIRAHEEGGQLPDLPPGIELDRVAWDAITRFAFLEYSFFYAYNDFERYQTALFDNEHEGDAEGCCLVFDRNVLNVAAGAGNDDALRRAVPHAIITSVHEEFTGSDIVQFVPPPVLPPDQGARDVVPFTVYVAGGSHATYLTPGNHDLVDMGDTFGFVDEKAPLVLVLAPGLVLAIAIILAIIEHFIDTEDFTSDQGVRSGPEDVVGAHPTAVRQRVITVPMSADTHVYQPLHEELLRLRSFPGKWGGHDGTVDKSPAYPPKTARYFRALLDRQ
jgi:hypothetical protein